MGAVCTLSVGLRKGLGLVGVGWVGGSGSGWWGDGGGWGRGVTLWGCGRATAPHVMVRRPTRHGPAPDSSWPGSTRPSPGTPAVVWPRDSSGRDPHGAWGLGACDFPGRWCGGGASRCMGSCRVRFSSARVGGKGNGFHTDDHAGQCPDRVEGRLPPPPPMTSGRWAEGGVRTRKAGQAPRSCPCLARQPCAIRGLGRGSSSRCMGSYGGQISVGLRAGSAAERVAG